MTRSGPWGRRSSRHSNAIPRERQRLVAQRRRVFRLLHLFQFSGEVAMPRIYEVSGEVPAEVVTVHTTTERNHPVRFWKPS